MRKHVIASRLAGKNYNKNKIHMRHEIPDVPISFDIHLTPSRSHHPQQLPFALVPLVPGEGQVPWQRLAEKVLTRDFVRNRKPIRRTLWYPG